MWILHRHSFQHILRDKNIAERKATFGFLRTVKIFASLSGREISRIADVVESVTYEEDAVIIQENDDADAMYILVEGQAVVSQHQDNNGSSDDDNKNLLRILKSGDYFGERALLANEKRSATITAASKVRVLRLDKTSFVELLHALHEQLTKKLPQDNRRSAAGQPSPQAARAGGSLHGQNNFKTSPPGSTGDSPMGARKDSSTPVDISSTRDGVSPMATRAPVFAQPRPQCQPSNLVKSKALGSGGYGRVYLVRDTATRRVYALKRVCKAHLLAHNGAMRCEWLSREKQVLEKLEHPFIVSLHGTYADTTSIYLLLGVAMGGDLYRLIEKLGQVPEKVSRFYVTSLVLALSHIHSHEVVYRDLKPENVLLDAQGYVKLCDFGFSKKVTDRTYTRCGTPDYTAPEMLLNQGVNQACDWWALGILIFEMLTGAPPFTDPDGDDMKTYRNITVGALDKCYPSGDKSTPEAKSLIKGLCTVKVAYRLGYLKGGADDVIAHSWFKGYDLDGLVNLTLPPPWRPQLHAFDDTQCFEDAEDSGQSLDGPKGEKTHPDELVRKWQALQEEYAGGSSLQVMSHLV